MDALKEYKLRSAIKFARESSDQMTPWQLALQMVDAIPSHLFNTQALVPGSGMGTFALALVHRGWSPDKIVCIELDAGFALYTKVRSPNINTIHTDYLTWEPKMQFDVIIGNPPYQRPKHAEGNKDNRPLWLEFLSKCGELLVDGGHMSLLVPGQVAKTTRWSEPGKGLKALKWGNITSIQTDAHKHFNVGTSIYHVTATKEKQSKKTLIDGKVEVDLTDRPWLPTIVTPDSLSIIDKVSLHANNLCFKLCPDLDGIEDQSILMYRMNQDYGYSAEITSKRRKTKANGEPLKLMWLNMDCGTPEQAENIKRLMRSKLFTALRRLTFYEPNYAHLFINGITYPDQIPHSDEEVYKAYKLTESEITLVESLQK